jgi:hypothetical protein
MNTQRFDRRTVVRSAITERSRRIGAAAALIAPLGLCASAGASPAAARVIPTHTMASGCHGRAYGVPSSGHYGSPATGSSAVAGHPGFREHYSWNVEGNVGRASIELRSFDEGTQAEQWYGVGPWSSGSGGATTVPWGNVLAQPAIRVLVPYGSPGVFVSFTC